MSMSKFISRRTFIAGASVACASIAGGTLLTGCNSGTNAGTKDASSDSSEASNGSAAENSATSADQTPASNATQSAIARPSTHGALHVNGTNLVNAAGNTVQLKGFSTHGLAWFPQYVNAECFAELAGWGANLARLAMYTHENGGYCTDGNQQELRDLLVRGVQYAADADMYCIVDWHVLQDLNPNVYLGQAKEFWEWASGQFASAKNVIFEICNEPNGSTTWADVKSYAETILPIIRKNAPTTPVLVGNPTWCQQPDLAAADPLDDENVMYTLHFYAGTHKDDLRSKLRSVVEGGTPVFVSEYGICDASGNGALDLDSANAWVALMNQLNVSYACWNLSNKAESSSFIASSCNKTAGFDDADLTPCGKWLKGMLGGDAPAAVDGADGTGAGIGSLTLAAITSSAGTTPAANLRQSWETNGAPYLLYDVTLSADSAVSAWDITLEFSSPVALSDSWNCTAEVSGSTLHLTPASYNASIASGAQLADIGLIVYPAS